VQSAADECMDSDIPLNEFLSTCLSWAMSESARFNIVNCIDVDTTCTDFASSMRKIYTAVERHEIERGRVSGNE
jgi:hypothetical protein